jgi:hypothetical protein
VNYDLWTVGFQGGGEDLVVGGRVHLVRCAAGQRDVDGVPFPLPLAEIGDRPGTRIESRPVAVEGDGEDLLTIEYGLGAVAMVTVDIYDRYALIAIPSTLNPAARSRRA